MVVYILTEEIGRTPKQVFRSRQVCIERINDLLKDSGIDEDLEVVDSYDPETFTSEPVIDTMSKKIKLLKQADFVYCHFEDLTLKSIELIAHGCHIPVVRDYFSNLEITEILRDIKKGENTNA